MTKEQLSTLSDEVRIPTELLLDNLRSIKDLPIINAALSDSGGVAFFFRNQREDGLVLTADIEIDGDGSVTASIIPYADGNEGLDVFQSEAEPIELWDIEEEPPFDETVRRIKERLTFPDWGVRN